MISFIFKCFISFFTGILINDLTESNTSLKFLGQTLFTNHSSFQFDMRLETFISLIVLTILAIIFIFFKNLKLIKALILKIIGFEFILFSFLKGLNTDGYDRVFCDKNLILIIGLFFLIILKIFCWKEFSNQEETKKIIYDSRKLDLEKLKKYLENSNVVGIDSEWGQGKSYFVDYWRKNENVTSVLISVLNTSKKDVIDFVLKQLDKQLLKEGQIETNSRVIKSFLSNQNFLGISFNGIFSSKTYKEALADYKKALKNRKNPLYVIFDDLDRVKEKELLIKVLNLGDEIQSDKLKILYLYDQKKLNILELDREYIEKFIPLTLGLTKLSFFDILAAKLKELKINLSIDEFDFLKTYFFEKNQDNQELLINPTPRNIEIFLKEIKSMQVIKEYNSTFNDIKKREIIAMIFFKVFYFENIYLNLKRLLESNWKNNNVLENLNKVKFVFNKKENNSLVLKQSIIETLGYIYMPKGAKDNEWNQKVKKNLNILYSLESIENLTTYEKVYKYIHELLKNFEISLEEKSKKYIEIDEIFNSELQTETFHGKEFLLIDWFCRESKIDEKEKLLEIIFFNNKITNTMILSISSEYILNNINFRKIIFDNLKNKEIAKLNKMYLEKFIREYFRCLNGYDILQNLDKIEKKQIENAIKNTKLYLKSIQIKIFKEEYERLDELEILFVKLIDNSNDLKVETSFSNSKLIQDIVKELKEKYLSKEEQFERIDSLIRSNQLDEYLVKSILEELLKHES